MEPFVGEIRAFAGAYIPEGWAICDGSAVSMNEYQVLYTLIGNTYGVNPPAGTFYLPKISGNVVVGTGQSTTGTNYTLGMTGGSAAVALTEAQMPAHSHPILASTKNATTDVPVNNMMAVSLPVTNYKDINFYSNLPSGVTGPNAVMDSNSVNPTGGNQPHNNVSPNMVMNYMIALVGLYPQQQ